MYNAPLVKTRLISGCLGHFVLGITSVLGMQECQSQKKIESDLGANQTVTKMFVNRIVVQPKLLYYKCQFTRRK